MKSSVNKITKELKDMFNSEQQANVKNNLVEIQVKQNSESISEMDSSSELSFSVENIGELEHQLKLEKDDRIISNLSLS